MVSRKARVAPRCRTLHGDSLVNKQISGVILAAATSEYPVSPGTALRPSCIFSVHLHNLPHVAGMEIGSERSSNLSPCLSVVKIG